MEFKIVPMDASHLDALALAEQACFSAPWSRNMLSDELYNDCAAYLVAEDETGAVLGYAGLQVVLDEGCITKIAVLPAFRRQKIAARLLQVFFDFAKAHELRFITLEVRAGNDAAIALYQKFGFAEVGRRKNYYEKPKEDALIMTKYFEEGAAC